VIRRWPAAANEQFEGSAMKRHHIIAACIAVLVAVALLANYYLW
jgi:hypothetical protein